MFYGSVGSAATVMEVMPKLGDKMAISQWRVTSQVSLASFGYSSRAFHRMNSDRWPKVWWAEWREGDPLLAKSEGNRVVHEFLCQQFTRKVEEGQEWKYKISIAIAESYLNAPREPEQEGDPFLPKGVLFPSVASDASADNIALLPEVADSALKLVEVHYVEVMAMKHEPASYTLRGIDYADSVSPDGQLHWRGNFPSHRVPGMGLQVVLDSTGFVLKNYKNLEVARIPFSRLTQSN